MSRTRPRLPDRRRWILIGLLSPIMAIGSLMYTGIVLIIVVNSYVPAYTLGVADQTLALGLFPVAGAVTGLVVAITATGSVVA